MEEIVKLKEWSDGVYEIKFGAMPVGTPDVYHIYKTGKYVAQRKSIEDAKQWVADSSKNK